MNMRTQGPSVSRTAAQSQKKAAGGFTLIELMITVAIVAILAAIALPSYQDYVTRSKITDATSTLANLRVQMEQYYQDNRAYDNPPNTGGACGVATPNTQNFGYVCAIQAGGQGYLITATGLATRNMQNFVYTINDANAHTTVSMNPGWSLPVPNTCWALKKDGSC
jgi:type IV pilus assembly protein PilE